MDSNTRSALLQLSDIVQSFHASFRGDTRVQGDPISDSLSKTFRLKLIPQKCQVFWKPRPLDQDAFKDVVSKVRDDRYEIPADLLPPPEGKSFEIYDAYHRSKSTHADIFSYASDGIFHSDDFCNTETGQCEFLCLEDFYVYHQIFVESIFVFCSPPRPHITVISIQPQQGPPDNLVLTELFTLIYWGMHFARRVKQHGSLPIRVVSICDTKARFLSANLTPEYLRYIATEKSDKEGLPVKLDISIGAYYEMSKDEEVVPFMRELVDIPVSRSVQDS
ncbi:hypothetical protein ABVK25_009300 [Lepraria finkii]|uniref:Uncharacterized protein n=1 Tax=Lepraria finkii TaxID=1340010 RepID=A0ABR4B095_9LECA